MSSSPPPNPSAQTDAVEVVARALYNHWRLAAPEWTDEYLPDNETCEDAKESAHVALEALDHHGSARGHQGQQDALKMAEQAYERAAKAEAREKQLEATLKEVERLSHGYTRGNLQLIGDLARAAFSDRKEIDGG
jgi:hypothetical protein